MLNKAKLSPRRGYVEIENLDGSRIHHKIHTVEDDVSLQQAQLKASSDRQEFLEDCIAEMAGIIYS